MKINLEEVIKFDISLLRKMFILEGFNLQEENYIVKEIDGKEVSITLYPELLSYEYVYRPGVYGDTKVVEDTTAVWIACRTNCFKGGFKDKYEFAKFIKNNIFENLPIKPFKDEDAIGHHFRETRHDDTIELAFFLNPHYANGWWENHVL